MADYIDREAFIADKRKWYCADCDRRKGMKNGKMRFVYDIGDAPCRACSVDDMFGDIEDYPAADVVERKRGEWKIAAFGIDGEDVYCSVCGIGGNLPYWNFCPVCGADMRGESE